MRAATIIQFVKSVQASARAFDVDELALRGRGKASAVMDARQAAMAMTWLLSSATYDQIGELFDRDHSTILHAVRVVRGKIDSDPKFRSAWQRALEHVLPDQKQAHLAMNGRKV